MNKKQFKNKKFVAATLAVVVLTTGTFAWQSFSQEVTNEIITEIGLPGGRLHDYFNGLNKDVFIENYASVDDGESVYARIRIDEYFEHGPSAGTTDAKNPTILRGDKAQTVDVTPTLSNKGSWDTYIYEAATDSAIRAYRELEFGGSSVYMPTFNQNLEDLTPDFNGTYRDSDGNVKEDPYDDFVIYEANVSQATGNITTADGIGASDTYTAKATQTADITTMADWLSDGAPISDTWVFDIDGWAYYAAPIAPQTATGLLLDKITIKGNPTDEWYYAVNVTAQIATAGDWGAADDEDTASSMYASNMTSNGTYLLNKVAGLVTVEDMMIKNTDATQVQLEDVQITAGTTQAYKAFYSVVNGANLANENGVDWTITEVETDSPSGADTSGVLVYTAGTDTVSFEPTADMVGYEYVITATSTLDASKSIYITVSVK